MVKLQLLTVLACVLVCAPLRAQEITIEGLDKLEVREADLYEIKGNTSKAYTWRVFPAEGAKLRRVFMDRGFDDAGNPIFGPGVLLKVSKRGRYDLVFIDFDLRHAAVLSIQVGSATPPPPPPLPPTPNLSEFTAGLVKSLDIEAKKPEVAKLFQSAIPKIDNGKLRGSKAIVEAVSKPIAGMNSVKWQAFSSLLFQHLLNDLKLVTQKQWSAAYKQVVSGIGGPK